MSGSGDTRNRALTAITVAWLITSVFYFYQYVMRSAPAVMMPQLGEAFDLAPVGLASLLGLFYYGYAAFSLIAGVTLDQVGPRKAVPLGAAVVAVGALLFATGDATSAGLGRFLQGAGGAFSLIGAAFIATTYFPAARAATFIGATQMFGMAGGSAGQFLVGPAMASGVHWSLFWTGMGVAGFAIAALLYFVMPGRPETAEVKPAEQGSRLLNVVTAMGVVISNPQSLLCGLIAGLMFLPTTIFDMVWGVRFLQEGHDLPYGLAVLRSASVPFGWIIGCPLLGAISDRLGRRKPVIMGGAIGLLLCLVLILYGPPGVFPPFSLGLAAGIASGAAMLPYTVIKEANRPEHAGTATGIINFLNFALTAALGPVFGAILVRVSDGGARELEHYQTTFTPLVAGVALAILLSLFLRETGPAAHVVKDARGQKPGPGPGHRPIAST